MIWGQVSHISRNLGPFPPGDTAGSQVIQSLNRVRSGGGSKDLRAKIIH